MTTSSDLKSQKLIDSQGRDILSFDDAWMTPPYDIQTMINAYKAGMIWKAEEILDHIEENLNLFEAELNKMFDFEAVHGKGCLLDLDGEIVKRWIDSGKFDDELRSAENYRLKVYGS